MALDEPESGDEMLKHDGIAFIIEKVFFEIAKPIRVTLADEGADAEFTVSSTILENDCSLADDPDDVRVACQIR